MKCFLIRRRYVCLMAGLSFCFFAHGQNQQERFDLGSVQLLESPFFEAEKTDLHYILSLSPDRLLAPYLREAGLPAKAKPYGNWESMGLDGHTAGHYLTALAQMYRSTGNVDCKSRLDYMTSELGRCQKQSPAGYVGGIPGGRVMWQALAKGDFSLFAKKWVPWYNLHKLFAGLRDAYQIGGNQLAKQILVRLSDWAVQELAGLSEAQIQTMLKTEYGGMNAVLADITELTGQNKYLQLAKKFCQPGFVGQLEDQKDELTGLHANTQIPKVIGFERIAQISPQDSAYDKAARFFWNTVVYNRSISLGGNSVYEHFNPINDFSSMIESVQGPETCNSYNMLKLTEDLFLSHPSGHYMDYYERCLYNHILSTERVGKGGFVYFTPIRPREYRVYSSAQKDFWCCVGTGMENHGKYGEMIYTHNAADLFVNLFIPSKLSWPEKGLILTQQNKFPYQNNTTLKLDLKEASHFSIFIRKPDWLKTSTMNVKVNGQKVPVKTSAMSYVEVSRQWHSGDQIKVELPMKDRLVQLPDHSNWVSIMHGPIVLAAATDTTGMVNPEGDGGRFDHIASGPLYPLEKTPILTTGPNLDLSSALKPVKGQPLTYTIASMMAENRYKSLKLEPFFQIHDSRFIVYWPSAKPGGVAKRKQILAVQDREVMRKSRKTIDHIAPGQQQPEVDHLMQSELSTSGTFKNRHYRTASDGYFGFTMKMTPDVRFLNVTYYGKDQAGPFAIYINDQKIASVQLDGSKADQFYTVDYPVAAAFKKADTVQVRFVATKGHSTARVFDIRLVK